MGGLDLGSSAARHGGSNCPPRTSLWAASGPPVVPFGSRCGREAVGLWGTFAIDLSYTRTGAERRGCRYESWSLGGREIGHSRLADPLAEDGPRVVARGRSFGISLQGSRARYWEI